MLSDKRKSGIPLIGELAWGSNFCQFYHTTEELLDTLISYFDAGVEKEELCVWITSEIPVDTAQMALVKKAHRFGEYLAQGKIKIIPFSQWRAMDGKPGGALLSTLDEAVITCFDGLRLAYTVLPENDAAPSFPGHEIGEIARYNVIAFFAYPHKRFDAVRLMEVIKGHRFALVKNAGQWDLIESFEARTVSDELKRSDERLKSLFSNMSEGFAFHRIVLDQAGTPCDYIFLDINRAFESLTGLNAADVIGKRVTQIMPGIENDPTNWISKYGEVALTGIPLQFESYAAALDRWYSISAFSPYKGYFAVTFSEITERKSADNEIKNLNEELKNSVSELSSANKKLHDSRRAALNLMDDALAARKEAEETSAELRIEIANRKLAEDMAKASAARLNLIAETASKLLMSESPQEVVEELCKKVMEFLDCQAFFNFLVDKDKGCLHLNACAGIPEEEAKRIEWLDYGVAVCGCAARDGCRIIAEDIRATPDPRTDLVKSYGIQAYACHPLMAKDVVLGTLSFGAANRTAFSEDDISLMKSVADHVAIAINRKITEDALRASEYRWQTTIDKMPDPVAICDGEGRVIYLNKVLQGLLERPIPVGLEMEGHAEYYQAYYPDGNLYPSSELPLQKAALTGQDIRDVEIIHRSPSGREFIAIFNAAPLRDSEGNITGAVTVGRDITELRSVERSLEKSRLDMIAILDNLPFIAWIKDREGRYQMVNKPFADACGCHSPEELVGKTDFDIWPESIARGYHSVDQEVMQSGKRKVLEEKTAVEGEEQWLETSKAPLFDLQGNVIGSTGVAKDITERKRAAEILQKSHEDLERLVTERTIDLASTVNALLDEAAVRESVEQNLQRLNLLYAVLSETDHAIVRADDEESLFNECCRIAVEHGGFLLAWIGMLDNKKGLRVAAAHGATVYLENISITVDQKETGMGPSGIAIKEGRCCICNDFLNDPNTIPWQERGRAHGIRSSAAIALKRAGKPIGAMTLYSDERDFFDSEQEKLLIQIGEEISFALDNFLLEKRRREAEVAFLMEAEKRVSAMEDLRDKEQMLLLQGRQAAMGEMIGNIAHQWRQPLNNLGLILQELPLCHEAGELDYDYLNTSIERSMQMISHMSQTIDGFRNFFRPDKEKIRFSAGDVVDKTLALLEGTLREQKISCSVEKLGEVLIDGYPNEFSQVLLNIMNNAKDAFIERSIESRKISITLFNEESRGVLTISDNAGGIPYDIIEKIFDPYFTTKGPDKGTGIGLFISKTIVEKNMHGTLWGRNIPGGTEFRIEF
jgi:PAS domain S-box-containing protein